MPTRRTLRGELAKQRNRKVVSRSAALVVLSIFAVLAVTACVDHNDPKTTGTTTTQQPPPPPPPPPPEKITADGTDAGRPRFKGCHGMKTHAVLYTQLNPPRVIGTTDIWSHCWIGGFTGTAAVVIGDADGETLTWAAPHESWGVNGISEAAAGLGPNETTVRWQAIVEDPSVIPLARTLSVENSWAPRNRLGAILAGAVSAGKTLLEVTAAISALIP